MIPDSFRAHGLGILLDEPIPEPTPAPVRPTRTVQRAAHTANLRAQRRVGVNQILDAQEDRDRALLRECNALAGAQHWHSMAAAERQRAERWRFVAAVSAAALAYCIVGAWSK